MILRDRTAIVTGAGSGIGRAAALIMAGEGAIVGVADRNAEGAEATVEQIHAAGGRAEALVSTSPTIARSKPISTTSSGAKAGSTSCTTMPASQVGGELRSGSSVPGIDASWSINVRAHFVGAAHGHADHEGGGRGVILNTASNSGMFYDREMIAYATTKHAVDGDDAADGGRLRPLGIAVNALCPGWVDTPFNEPFIGQMGGRGAVEAYVS